MLDSHIMSLTVDRSISSSQSEMRGCLIPVRPAYAKWCLLLWVRSFCTPNRDGTKDSHLFRFRSFCTGYRHQLSFFSFTWWLRKKPNICVEIYPSSSDRRPWWWRKLPMIYLCHEWNINKRGISSTRNWVYIYPQGWFILLYQGIARCLRLAEYKGG